LNKKHSDNKKIGIGKFNKSNQEDYDHIKSKNGIRVLGNTDVAKFPQELLPQIKKISNFVSGKLMPLTQTLYETNCAGISAQERSTIPVLYHDMDDKIYILTSFSYKITQLVKLDKEFDKLFHLVKNALANYSGGSMPMSMYKQGQGHLITDKLYLL
jgi:hypothetical protein